MTWPIATRLFVPFAICLCASTATSQTQDPARVRSGERIIVIPTSGGSAGLYHFDEVLRTPIISVPIVNHDNSQHAANENLRLQNLLDGMQVYAGIIAHLGRVWSDTP